MIKGLIFDMDGLVFNSERVVQRTWQEAGKELGIQDMGSQIYNTIGFNRKRRTEYFQSVFGMDFPDEEFAVRTRQRFYEIVEEEGLEVKPGVRELLSYAKQNGYKLGVATSSGSDYAAQMFKDAGIYDYFDGFVYGNMVTHSKPAPEIYEKACEALRLAPEECVALEDAPAGIQSAVSAGLRAIMIPDLVMPSGEIRDMAWKVYDTLMDVKVLLATQNELH